MPSVKSFKFPFPICVPFISLSCLIAVARASGKMLSRSIETVNPCLVTNWEKGKYLLYDVNSGVLLLLLRPLFLSCLSFDSCKLMFLTKFGGFGGFLGGASDKNPPANAGDLRDPCLIPGLGRSPGAGHGNAFQYPCLENPMDRGAWRATVHRVTKSRTGLKWLSVHAWGVFSYYALRYFSSLPFYFLWGLLLRMFWTTCC